MNTIYFTEPTTENITAAADIIRRGGLLGIPTETVYGLGASVTGVIISSVVPRKASLVPDIPIIVEIQTKR